MEGKILGINIAENGKGRKWPLEEADLRPGQGFTADAASGQNNGGISIISQSTYEKMREMGVKFFYGDFGENIRVGGMVMGRLPIGTQIKMGEAVVEVLEKDEKYSARYVTVRGYAGDLTILLDKIHAQVVIAGKIKAGDKVQVLHESLS